jgi:aspartyl-tRNA(Asn)/glutamyl-tRNA(Gln) amidotransferase subunit C
MTTKAGRLLARGLSSEGSPVRGARLNASRLFMCKNSYFELIVVLCLWFVKRIFGGNLTGENWRRIGDFSAIIILIMAKLTREDVLKLAQLARLELTDAEVDEFSAELSEILQYVEKLGSVDTAGLEPTNQVTGLTNVTREDEVRDYGYKTEELLKNLPAVQDDLIKVKRMIG